MTHDRIQQVLDGELPRERLTPEERTRLNEYEALISAAAYIGTRRSAPDMTDAVMRRVRERAAVTQRSRRWSPVPAIAEAFSWLVRPRTVALRPAWALAVLALLVSVPLLRPGPAGSGAPTVVAANDAAADEAAEPTIFVHFRLDAPEASSVRLAGDFSDWQPRYELRETAAGVWSVVVPLQPGVHDYAFVVDGDRWTPDPLATRVDDGFGGENSRMALLPPEQGRT